jgi:hypothetical protein
MQVPTPQASVQAGLVEHVRALLPLLKSLFYSRASLEKQMGQVFASHPEAAWWKSLPGLSGPLTAARLLAWIGDNRERFPSAQVLQAVAGTVPVTRRSGKLPYAGAIQTSWPPISPISPSAQQASQ